MKTIYYSQNDYERACQSGGELELFESEGALCARPRDCDEFIEKLWNYDSSNKDPDYVSCMVSVTIMPARILEACCSRVRNLVNHDISRDTYARARKLLTTEIRRFAQTVIHEGAEDKVKNYKNIMDYCIKVGKKIDGLAAETNPDLNLSSEDLTYLLERIKKQCNSNRAAKDIRAYIKEVGVLDKHFTKKSLSLGDIEGICDKIAERFAITQQLEEISTKIHSFANYHHNKNTAENFKVAPKNLSIIPKIKTCKAQINVKNARVVKHLNLLEPGDKNIMLKNYGCLKFSVSSKESGYMINDLSRLKTRAKERD